MLLCGCAEAIIISIRDHGCFFIHLEYEQMWEGVTYAESIVQQF